LLIHIESKGKKGDKLVNKSYSQSERSMMQEKTDDPEAAKDFKAAYSKVRE
jgi:hypothetical protein